MARRMRCAANLVVLGLGTLATAGPAAPLPPQTANSTAGAVATTLAGAGSLCLEARSFVVLQHGSKV